MKTLRILATLVISLLFISRCSHASSHQVNPSLPVFGSFAAESLGLRVSASDYRPKHILTEAGKITGNWLKPNDRMDLNVLVDTELEGARTISERQPDGTWKESKVPFTFPEDHFIIKIGKEQKEHEVLYFFEAAYGTFTIFPCDIDGDGIDEIFLESGQARGTSVHVRKLRILKNFSEFDSLVEILEVPLNGYIPSKYDPLSWERHYWLSRTLIGFDVVFDLVPPEEIPDYLASEEYLWVIQHPRIRFSYNSKLKSYVIKNERLTKRLRE